MALNAEEIIEVYKGFEDGRTRETTVVRSWVEAVVHGGNWRFGDSEGVVQDVVLKLYQLVKAGKVQEPGGFQKMAYTVAKFRCVDIYQAERRRREREGAEIDVEQMPVSSSSADEALRQREQMETLAYIVQRLSKTCRELWDLVYRQKKPQSDIAEELGVTVNNLRVRVHRCLESARKIYAEHAMLSVSEVRDE